ncbi:aldo/keto reductase [Kouleothrix sp.]|uniref:aldo/keto reductase n=1 Tax=Kouleothrix sp. TaxID=2779161 RepID=UPI00391A56CA
MGRPQRRRAQPRAPAARLRRQPGRLQTDYIDLYQTHWYDAETPIDETLDALNDLVRAGKVRYIGCSNIPAWRLALALGASERRQLARYDALQPHYNLAHRDEFERELAGSVRRPAARRDPV